MSAAIGNTTLRPAYFMELEFGDTVLHLTDRGRDIDWDSVTWRGAGWVLPLRTIEELDEVVATGCEVTLSGNVASIVALSLVDAKLSNTAKIWFGLLDGTDAVIETPLLIFAGKLDIPTITQNGSEILVTLSYESELRGLLRPNEFRYTTQNQQAFFPGDKGFDYVPLMETWDGYWGKPERPKWLRKKRATKR